MCGERHVGDHLVVGWLVEAELEHADGLPAVGHRREQARPVCVGFPFDCLGCKRAAVGAPHQRNSLGGFPPLSASGRGTTRVAEPDERMTAEVRDQERQLTRTERGGQTLAQDIHGGDGWRILDGREQRAEVQPRR